MDGTADGDTTILTRRPARWGRIIALVLLVCVAVVAIPNVIITQFVPDTTGWPRRALTTGDLTRHPEAALWFPRSRVVSSEGADQSTTLLIGWATEPASIGHILTTAAPVPRVLAWYDHWMITHHWRHWKGFVFNASWMLAEGYARGLREEFTVAIWDPSAFMSSGQTAQSRERTVYEMRYVVEPYGHIQPEPGL